MQHSSQEATSMQQRNIQGMDYDNRADESGEILNSGIEDEAYTYQ